MNKTNTNQNENITQTNQQSQLFNSIKNITSDITNNIFKDTQTDARPKQKLDIKQFYTGEAFLFE